MRIRTLFYIVFFATFQFSGCAGTVQEIITCDPPQADIYWGKTPERVFVTGHKTPYSRSLSISAWESWCYQVKKDGYFDSEIVCREEETYRYLDFSLTPLKTTITSAPSDATIYWGPFENLIHRTVHKTPRSVIAKDAPEGASWKDWYFQVRKEGYHDSAILFLSRQPRDRNAHFELNPFKLVIHRGPELGAQVTLAWEDHSSNGLGFEIERKKGRTGNFSRIDSVGPGVTRYIDAGLEKGTIYYYRVRTQHSYGYSAYSEETRVRIPID
jgi:hypothetical protein